jgi:hypothetical protein
MSAQLAKAINLARRRHANFSRKESRRTTANGIACMTQQEPGRNRKPTVRINRPQLILHETCRGCIDAVLQELQRHLSPNVHDSAR